MVKQLNLNNVRIYKNTKADIIDALDLMGEEVYLSDCADFRSYAKAKLTGVIYAEDDDHPFFHRAGNQSQWGYRYLILAKDAKFIEDQPKKLRPFDSSSEFTAVTGCNIGDVITIHSTDGGFDESCVVSGFKYLDTELSKPSIVYITLGTDKYTFEELLQHFKYHKDDGWYPFGVEE